ncbi:hypothetical protein [Sphingomonas sp. TZW2008]|uniref:hypothetical protein n=1 Tax=Sphingomonas sp. TZW2008 TaxID=1917973 RepID=UPI000A26CC3F|nr:hypothetical protein [Sphingomonas sp. TZW2008]
MGVSGSDRTELLRDLEHLLTSALDTAEAAGELVVALHVAHALETLRPGGLDAHDAERLH